jgi:hypothetical protein
VITEAARTETIAGTLHAHKSIRTAQHSILPILELVRMPRMELYF